MEVVNVDSSEYDVIIKRNSKLDERLNELIKLKESLKHGQKVIILKRRSYSVSLTLLLINI